MADASHSRNLTRADTGPGALLTAQARRYLTIAELSETTGISISTLQRPRRKGLLPSYQPGGARTRIVFPADAIEQATRASQAATQRGQDGAAVPQGPTRGPRLRWQGGAA
jgi:hypothetical protein